MTNRSKFFISLIFFLILDVGFLINMVIRLHFFGEIHSFPENVILLYVPAIFLMPLIVLTIFFKRGKFPGISGKWTKDDIRGAISLYIFTISAVISYGIGVIFGLLGARELEWWIASLSLIIYVAGFFPLVIIIRLSSSRRRKNLWKKIRNAQEVERRELKETRIALTPDPLHLYEYESSIIKFLDELYEHPFNYIYKKKKIKDFLNMINEIGTIRQDITESWKTNNIENGIVQIIQNAESIAKENGIYHSKEYQSMKYTLICLMPYLGIFAVVFVFVELLVKSGIFWVWLSFSLGTFILIEIIYHHFSIQWKRLDAEKQSMMNNSVIEIIERLRSFIQFLIEDLRKILANNNINPAYYRLVLNNPNYNNINVQKWRSLYIIELLPLASDKNYSSNASKSSSN